MGALSLAGAGLLVWWLSQSPTLPVDNGIQLIAEERRYLLLTARIAAQVRKGRVHEDNIRVVLVEESVQNCRELRPGLRVLVHNQHVR